VRGLTAALKNEGDRNIGFPGGNHYRQVYSAGEGELWAAFFNLSEERVPRFWNAFGVFNPAQPAQTITVEINIPMRENTAQVAGFFAEDNDTGDVFLMHSGKVGGGRKGVGKTAFLVWSKAKLIEVKTNHGGIRTGIAVARINDKDLSDRIWKFVANVNDFKIRIANGDLKSPDFQDKMKEYETYNKEYSGKKKGSSGGPFEYVAYHGDIVQKIYSILSAKKKKGEVVYNSQLIDLYVKQEGQLTEVYEVKTIVDRQILYTAIGQLLTHARVGESVSKFLILPAGENIAQDFKTVISNFKIQVLRFKIVKSGRTSSVVIKKLRPTQRDL
jgi:hypothetical protein